jgi:SAM-dependent methyltransferase
MTDQAPWPAGPVPPQGLDVTVPNVARIYDHLLGGKDNFEADREAARRLLAVVPDAARAARANRTFLARAVQFLAREAGIRQFLDIGTGLPTRGNVHEIAQVANPQAHVLYTDIDPMVVVHASALLANSLTVAATQADLRQPEHLFTMPVTRTLIDISQPLAVLLVAVLHFLPDNENPWALVDEIKRKLAPGSCVVISHVTADEIPAGAARQASEVYRDASAPGVARSRDDIARFFSGLDMVAPGLVDAAAWRTPHLVGQPRPALFYAGIGRKPLPRREPQVVASDCMLPPAVAGS